MSFSYDLATDIGVVRFEIDDTDSAAPMFQDEEINLKLTGNSLLKAAADLCDVLATRYARRVDFTVDGQTVRLSNLVAQYAERAKTLRARADSVGTIKTQKADGYTDSIDNDSNTRSGARHGDQGGGDGTFDVGRWDIGL